MEPKQIKEPVRILYVEGDSFDASNFSKRILELAVNAQLTRVRTLSEAISHLERKKTDVVISDIKVANCELQDSEDFVEKVKKGQQIVFESGLEFLAHVQEKFGVHPIAISRITGSINKKIQEAGVDYISKDISYDLQAGSARDYINEYLRKRQKTEPLHVLYVDDDYKVAANVARMVEQKLAGKAVVTHAPAIYDALQQLKKNQVDVLVTDVQIPKVEKGIDYAKKMRELRERNEDFESGIELLEHAHNVYGTHPLAISFLATDEIDKTGVPFIRKSQRRDATNDERDAEKIAAHLEKIIQNRPAMAQLKINLSVLDQLGAVIHPDPSGKAEAIYLTKAARESAEKALKTADDEDLREAQNYLLKAENMVQGLKSDRRTTDLGKPFETSEDDDGIMARRLRRISDAIKGKGKK